MTNYRIFGDLVEKYYIDIEAEDLQSAYKMADSAERHKWVQMELDNTIEPYDYEELVITSAVHEYRGQIVEL